MFCRIVIIHPQKIICQKFGNYIWTLCKSTGELLEELHKYFESVEDIDLYPWGLFTLKSSSLMKLLCSEVHVTGLHQQKIRYKVTGFHEMHLFEVGLHHSLKLFKASVHHQLARISWYTFARHSGKAFQHTVHSNFKLLFHYSMKSVSTVNIHGSIYTCASKELLMKVLSQLWQCCKGYILQSLSLVLRHSSGQY